MTNDSRQNTFLTVFSSETSTNWSRTPEYNLVFIRQIENHLNDRLRASKMLCLNDVLWLLGMDIFLEGYSYLWNLDDGDTVKIEVNNRQLHDGALTLIIGRGGKPRLTQSNAPVALVATLGHPANQHYIVKKPNGFWYSLETGRAIDDEDFRAGWQPYIVDLEVFTPFEEI